MQPDAERAGGGEASGERRRQFRAALVADQRRVGHGVAHTARQMARECVAAGEQVGDAVRRRRRLSTAPPVITPLSSWRASTRTRGSARSAGRNSSATAVCRRPGRQLVRGADRGQRCVDSVVPTVAGGSTARRRAPGTRTRTGRGRRSCPSPTRRAPASIRRQQGLGVDARPHCDRVRVPLGDGAGPTRPRRRYAPANPGCRRRCRTIRRCCGPPPARPSACRQPRRRQVPTQGA